MRDVSYLAIVILLTAGILTGLFFYNKGTIEEISGTLSLNQNINLNFERVATKPAESNRYYVIFYVNAINNSSDQATLRVQPPINPCTQYERYPGQMTYLDCLASSGYQQYQQKEKEYQSSYQSGKLELMTPQNQKCELNSRYQINNKYPNIGVDITYYTFQANEKKVGSVVFVCPEESGRFTLKYLNNTVEIGI